MRKPSAETSAKPLVLVPACNYQTSGGHLQHTAGKKYVDAVRLAGCTPLIVPAAEPAEVPALLALADGVLLTGSPSNVHPSHFGEDVHDTQLPLDVDRDAWTLPLIPLALARGMPFFAICRRPKGRPATHMFTWTPMRMTLSMLRASRRFQISTPLSLMASLS